MRKIIIPAFMLIMLLVVSAGCGKATADARRGATRSMAHTVQTRADAAVESSNEATAHRSIDSAAERGEKLSNHISGVEGVDKVSAVITGNTAIIGISLAGELEDFSDRRLMRLKTKIENEARLFDPSLAHVAVTTSGELIERINNLADPLGFDDTPPRTTPETERIINELTPPV